MDAMDRRDFMKKTALSGAAIGIAGPLTFARATQSPNDGIAVAIMGGRARARALAYACARTPGLVVKAVFDVDLRPLPETAEGVRIRQGTKPEYGTDFRISLEDADVDALVISAPDHWHTPAALMALKAGKHVYVEKPGSHNPREAELIVLAQRHYGKHVQMGNQQRSSPETQEAVREVQAGAIGNAYFAKAFFASDRASIGRGRETPVPDWLDYDLWQGPAPRTPYRDNVIHYNWHWFWKWGTGELLNNGTHDLDVCRWALGVDYPNRVFSNGGRYHYDDDWEFCDTQNVSMDFPGGKSIQWEGRSCNGYPVWSRRRGSVIYGTEGTMIIDRGGYVIYDRQHREVKKVSRGEVDHPDKAIAGDNVDDLHLYNFARAIRAGERLHSPIDEGQKSVLPLHIANISQVIGRSLTVDPDTGRIVDDDEAMGMWTRDYEPGWEPVV